MVKLISYAGLSEFLEKLKTLFVMQGTTGAYPLEGTGLGSEIFNFSSNTASSSYTHAEGFTSEASGYISHAQGNHTKAQSSYAHAEGSYSTAKGASAHAEGDSTWASGNMSHAQGYATMTTKYCQHVMGAYNVSDSDGTTNSYNAASDALIIGNGSSSGRSNAFRVTFAGATYGLSAFNSSGADYAEYFEWEDGNPDAEDRIGHFVTLVNDKIQIATTGDDVIGVVSGMSSIIGDANEDMYHDMYARDVFGRFIYEDVEAEQPTGEVDAEGNSIMETVTEHRIKQNPDYDASQEYIPRSQRKEWDVIGLLGKMVVIDDGTCAAGGRCSFTTGGIATSGTAYRVLKRIDHSHILILASFI